MPFNPSNPLILKTDGGPHPPGDFAAATAHRVLPIYPATRNDAGSPRR